MSVSPRRLTLGIINALSLLWLLYVVKKGDTDFMGLWVFIAIVMLFLFNLYALVLGNFILKNAEKKMHLEALFFILLFLPILIFFTASNKILELILSLL